MKLHDVDLRLLQIFVEIVESGGFTPARVRLNLEISTLSVHMKHLETRLGLTLARRGRAGFQLTPQGEAVFAATKKLLEAIDIFETETASLKGETVGTLVLGASENLIFEEEAAFQHALTRFVAACPEVRLTFVIDTPEVLERRLIEGTVDVAVCPSRRHIDTLVYREAFRQPTGMYAGRGNELFETDDDRLPMDLLRTTRLVRNGSAAMLYDGALTTDNDVAVAYNTEAVAALIRTGNYIGWLPVHYARRWVERGELRLIKPAVTVYEAHYFVITRNDRPTGVRAAFLAAWDGVQDSSVD
ncbi:hypothetical protein C3941_14930 [Kaistia algarum]|uniref:LysR family transcriptional regulator n=1 Tax=Kaistia algarum TaxID=2083279 RepID=UPI000CE85501|nr:LysR family transcriptional regulator [Kaistia algarum]MCX5514367.1 LysR family transcriptional regulator [Kaistia algarum]PPE79115.1 hypothetical protein C3941_14930 [Kaistia algarum]